MEALLKILIPILVMVESGGDPNAVGDRGLAVGILQIHPIMVREVNRIAGQDRYTLSDRRNVRKSVEMCAIYLNYWGRRKIATQGNFESNLVLLARLWNGGPNGDRKKSTRKYGEKVRKIFRQELKKR